MDHCAHPGNDNDENARLKAALEEKEVLLKELHHRVKNNLQVVCSLLSLQAQYVQDERALAVFKDSQNRIRLMASIHEALYRHENLTQLDASELLEDISRNLLRSYAIDPDAIRLNIDVANVSMNIETAVPCGLIVNELLSNALKYAFPDGRRGEVHVELRAEDDAGYVLRVRDNGVGVNGDQREVRTLGTQLVLALAHQLGGDLSVHNDDGTRVTVKFPSPRERK